MKSINEFLTESHKTYPWKIGVAGDLPEGCEASLRQCMEKWTVASFAKAKKTPIQERPLDFPQLENIDVQYYDAEVRYPTTRDIVQEYIAQCCDIPTSHVIVRHPDEPQEKYQEEKTEGEYETLLTQEDMGGESAQEDAGESRIMGLLKELETARKENDASSGYKSEAVKEEPQNNNSVVGN
jgi:hypothetical protein